MQEHPTVAGDVTIVIPTHDRPLMLRRLLQSIERQNPAGRQPVIVVDDSEAPSDFRQVFPKLEIEHIVSPRRLYISKAKNIGWRSARTRFVYFIDDDNVTGETTFWPLFRTMSSKPGIGALMPGVLYFAAPGLVWVYATPFLNRRLVMNLVGRNLRRDPSLERMLLKTDALPNASLVRVRALEDVDGFDEKLVVNSSMDLTQRLKGAGWKVYAQPEATILHDVELPGRVGWWASHGSADPERVRYELRDWFLFSKRLHPDAPLFRPYFALRSLRFVGPNLLAYALRGGHRLSLLRSVMRAYAEGFELTGGKVEGYHLAGDQQSATSSGGRRASGRLCG